jgi:hypothetical protein
VHQDDGGIALADDVEQVGIAPPETVHRGTGRDRLGRDARLPRVGRDVSPVEPARRSTTASPAPAFVHRDGGRTWSVDFAADIEGSAPSSTIRSRAPRPPGPDCPRRRRSRA